MTKEITKSIILQKIQDRLGLREFAAAKFLLDETVGLAYDIHRELELWRSHWSTRTVTGTGPVLVATVPGAERWRLRSYSVTFISGTYTVAGGYIFRTARRDLTDFSYLDLTAAQSVAYLVTLPDPVTLEPGDAFMINVDGYTATGDLRVDYDYMVEEIR